ncbi:MAG: hypothetical protein QOH06_1537 [Acidobacteriota bacterium]|jgi:hypothetical protein|nr:hypothetical protein [Acidobacteriota bacterium]
MRLDRLSGLLMTLLALWFCPPPPARATLIPRSGDALLTSDFHELSLSCPAVAVGADGAAVTVWTRTTNFRGPVLSRRVETDGTIGPEIQLSDDGELASNPGIVAMEGGYVAFWTRDAFPPGSPFGPTGTVVRFLDAHGMPADIARIADDEADSRVVAVGDRLAIVTRHDFGLRLRLIDRQGADVYAPRQFATSPDVLFSFALASDGEGGVVIAWQVNVQLGGGLKAQAFDAAGQPRSKPVVVARSVFPGTILHVAAGGGRFVVGWTEDRPNGVELRVFSLTGERLGAPRLPRATGSSPLRSQLLTDLVAAGPQGVMVVWNAMSRLGGQDLFAAGLEWDWERTTRSTSLPADRLGQQMCGRVATNGNGDWAAAWKEASADSSTLLVTIEARTFDGPLAD